MNLALPIILAQAAGPQYICAPYDNLAAALGREHGETVRLGALTSGGGILEFYGDESDGSWTVVVVLPDRETACFLSVGEGFVFIADGEPA